MCRPQCQLRKTFFNSMMHLLRQGLQPGSRNIATSTMPTSQCCSTLSFLARFCAKLLSRKRLRCFPGCPIAEMDCSHLLLKAPKQGLTLTGNMQEL